MSILNRKSWTRGEEAAPLHTAIVSEDRAPAPAGVRSGLLSTCANLGCRSGWLHLGRSRSRPIFEGGWTCSPECTAERIAASIRRELEGRGAVDAHRHRLPLGLLMLEQGWITTEQLKKAREAQRTAGGKFGEALVNSAGVSEALLTRALSRQWSCPVLSLDGFDPDRLSAMLPRLFVDALGAVPLRIAAGKLLYVGFENRPNPVLTLALERMTGLSVEGGVIQGSFFRAAHARLREGAFPPVEMLEGASEAALVRALAKTVERVRPVEGRLVRIHDWFWLRLWRERPSGPAPERTQIQDILCTLSAGEC